MQLRIIALCGLTMFGCAGSGGKAPDSSCRGPGKYEAGKEGSYRPCCAGLREVQGQKLSGYSADGTHLCFDPPLNVYICVKGNCGDGICEEGESAPCGCVADCPSAVWEGSGADAGATGKP